MSRISITHFSNAHNEWLRGLDFYKQELSLLQQRLTEIAGKNSAKDVLAQVDHFENQFKIQLENMAILAHDINVNLDSLSHQAHESNAGYVDGDLLNQHNDLGARYLTEEAIIKDLRLSFNKFAAEWM